MALKLNSTRQTYEAFEGSNVKQMLKLIADGRVPMNTAQLMQKRLDVRNDNDLKVSYIDNYFDTGDGVVYHPDGRVKIVLDSQDLRDMTPDTPRNSGALILTSEAYDTLQGEEFKKGKLGKTGERMSREDVKSHPVWKALAGDQSLLNDYTDFIFAEGKQRFGYDKAMGIYTTSANGDTLEMRAWCVCRLENRSLADGWDYLDNDGGRFLGIAPEAQGAIGKGVGGVKAYTMNDLQEAEKQLDNLSQVVKSESLEKVRSLVGKLQF